MLESITSPDLARLARELSRVDRELGSSVRKEFRRPLQKMTNELKGSARSRLPKWVAADAASGIRYSTSYKGYKVARESNDRFTQHGYSDATGSIRHPLYGNRDYWYDTEIAGAEGWWTEVVARTEPIAILEFEAAVWNVIAGLSEYQ